MIEVLIPLTVCSLVLSGWLYWRLRQKAQECDGWICHAHEIARCLAERRGIVLYQSECGLWLAMPEPEEVEFPDSLEVGQ